MNATYGLGAVFGALALGAAVLAAPLAAQESRLVVAFPAQPANLDTHVSTPSVTNQVGRMIYEGLITQDSQFRPQPALARSWDISADGLTYTFHLRDGVTFHNGQPLTAEDVVVSMERWTRLSGPGRAALSGATWSAGDDGTVILQAAAPSFVILYALASGSQQTAAVMPASILTAAGDLPVQEAIGTGPFRLSDWTADQSMTLTRFEDYTPFEGPADGLAGDRTATVDTLEIVFVSDEATRTFGLQTGQYDIAAEVPYDAVEELRAEGIGIMSYTWSFLNVIFNKTEGLFTDVNARRAVHVGLDREEILLAAIGSEDFFALNHHQMLVSQTALWDTDVGRDEFNPVDRDQARALFAQAGYDGRELVILTSRDYSEMYYAAVVLQQQLTEMGVASRIESYDWPTFTQRRARPEAWDLLVLTNVYRIEPSLLTHYNAQFPGWTNDPALPPLLAAFRAAPTIEAASDLYDDLQTWFNDYLPATKVGDLDMVIGYGARVAELPELEGPIYWSVRLNG